MQGFDVQDLKDFASAVGAETRERGNELDFKFCPYCEGGGKDKYTFSVNMESGQFSCFRSGCGVKGNFRRLCNDFEYKLPDSPENGYKVFEGSLSTIEWWTATEESERHLRGRLIPERITDLYRVTTYDKKENILVFPFFDDDCKLVDIKYRNMSFKKGEGSKEWFERDTRKILYGMWVCSGNERLVVTEGQIDALSLAAAGIQDVVSVPGGAKNFKWVQNCRAFVERYAEIVIFGDYEHGAVTLVDGFLENFPDKSIKVVRGSDYLGCKDANEILKEFECRGDIEYGCEMLRKAVEQAEDAVRLPVRTMQEVEWFNSDEEPVLKTLFPTVDRTIRGLSFGQLVVLTGWSGDGKSNYASQLMVNAISQGYKGLIYSGELSNQLVKEQISYIIAGNDNIEEIISQDGWTTRQLKNKATTRQLIHDWLGNKLYIWEDRPISQDSTNPDETSDFLNKMQRAVKQLGIRILLLDNLMTLLTVGDDTEQFNAQSLLIKKLKTIARQLNIIIVLVAHPRKAPTASRELTQDSISGSKDIVNLADVLMAYTRHNDEEKKEYARRLNILKNRRTGLLMEGKNGVYLRYSAKSNRIAESAEDAAVDLLGTGTESIKEVIPF